VRIARFANGDGVAYGVVEGDPGSLDALVEPDDLGGDVEPVAALGVSFALGLRPLSRFSPAATRGGTGARAELR